MNSATNGRCFHPFSAQKNWSDFGFSGSPSYVVSQVKFRLIKWNETGVDNRANANLCVNVGGDYWIYKGASFDSQWRHNGDFAIGNFIKATNDWQYAYATSCPQSWDKGFPDELGVGDSGETIQYTISNSLSNATTSNNATLINANTSYSTTITPNNGYTLSTVRVTMGGTDITSSVYSNGVITIASVTGNIVITATAESSNLVDSTGAYMIDDFTGTSLDRSKWDYEWGYVRNGELQNYQDTNAVVNNGILELQGRKDSNGTWTSASIISKGHFAFMYGKIECRAKIDPTWGSFSAFWTLGDSFEFGYHNWASPDTLGEYWAWCGEFDVMEFYSGKLTCGTFFNEKEESGRVWYNNYDFNAWHTFAMEWLEDGTLIFSIDGNELSRTNPTDNKAFHIPHFILINQAIGASGGTPADSTTAITQYVDWVKYYPASTENLVLNSSDFSLQVTDTNDSAHNCMVRPIFNDNCINKSLTWSSSDSSLVWVHSGLCSTYDGANGTVTITATSHSGVSKTITLYAKNGKLSATA